MNNHLTLISSLFPRALKKMPRTAVVTTSMFKLLLLSGCVAIVITGCSGSEDREEKYLQRAQDYMKEKNFEKSRIETKNVLQINPKNSAARVLMAKLHQQAGEYRQAFLSFNTAVEEDPSNVEAKVGLAKMYYASGENDAAQALIDKALELAPNDRDALVVSAGLLSRAGHVEKAIAIAHQLLNDKPSDEGAIAILASAYSGNDPSKSLEIINKGLNEDPDNETLKNLKLSVLTQLKDAEGVESLLKELVSEHPSELDYHFRLARGYSFQNRLEEADKVLANAVDKNPESDEARKAYIQFIAQQRGLEQAEGKLKEFIAIDPDNYYYHDLLSQLYLAGQRKADAEGVFKTIINNNPTSANALRARNSLATLSLVEGNRAEAEALLADIFALEPANTDALVTRSRISMSDNKLDDASADLRAALKNDSENIEALRLLATVQERSGTPDLALESYRRLVTVDSQDVKALVQAGRLSMDSNQIDTAEKYLLRALTIDPQNLQAITLQSKIYVANKQWDQAIELANRLLTLESTAAAGHVIKGTVYREKNEWNESREEFKMALDLSPTTFEPLGGYIDTYLVEKDYEGAIRFLEYYLKDHSDLIFAKDILASIYIRADKHAEAIKIYQDIIEANPNIETGYQKLAAIYSQDKNYQKAEAVYQQGLAHNAGFTSLRVYLANLYELQGQYKESKEQYELVLAAQPNAEVVRNNLAVLLVNHFPSDANFARALTLIEDFSRSKQPVFLDTLGWTHYHLGNIPQAISYLEASINRGQGTPEFHYHLGMAYHKSGQAVKAKEHLSLAVREDGQKYFGIDEAERTLKLL